MLTTIKKFHQINVIPKSLIVLDIDETILKFEDINHKWWKSKINRYYKLTQSFDLADSMAHNDWVNLVFDMQPELVDDKFHNFLEHINKHDCETILLTARNNKLKDLTNQHLNKVDLKFKKIFFNENKGDELYNIVHNDFLHIENIIVVDDLLSNLTDIKNKFLETKFNLYLYNITE